MRKTEFFLTPTYGKQSVPVFKIVKNGAEHSILDMVVRVMLEGDVAESWLTGENHQILPTETQKNTCYAIALKASFDCVEDFALALGRDLLARHAHINKITIDGHERVWTRHKVGGTQPHNHVFQSSKAPVLRTCTVVLPRGQAPVVTCGVSDIKLMKTAMSGFTGFIRDQYTNLQPVGEHCATPERIMCTEMVAKWRFAAGKGPEGKFANTNAKILQMLADVFAGPADKGVFSKSLQETAYKMATEVLKAFPDVEDVLLEMPNVHFYRYDLEQFGLQNPNVVFQSTDSLSTASGRIITRLSRDKSVAKL